MTITITIDDSVGPELVKSIASLINLSESACAERKAKREEEALKNHPQLPLITEQ